MKVKEQAKELASLLGVSSPQEQVNPQPTTNQVVDESTEELAPEPVFEFDYNKTRKYFIKKAKDSIKKIVRVVINDSTLIDKSFIADKIDQDAEQLGQLYYQQRKTEVMQEANMESVRTGNVSPRMFEVFTQMGKNLMDINKQIAEFQISIKENYAKIKFDTLDDVPMSGISIETSSDTKAIGQGNVFKNAKEINVALMEERKKRMIESKKRMEYQESDFEEIKETEKIGKEDIEQ